MPSPNPVDKVSGSLTSTTPEVHAVPPEYRLQSQRSAFARRRSHALRAFVRTVGLVAGDTSAFLVAQSVVAWVQGSSSNGAHDLGWIEGWQLAGGLLVGLLLLGAYGAGDRWRSWRKAFQGVSLGVALSSWQALWLAPVSTAARWAMLSALFGTVVAGTRGLVSTLVGQWRLQEGRREGVVLIRMTDAAEGIASSRIFGPRAPFSSKAVITVEGDLSGSCFTARVQEAAMKTGVSTVMVAGFLPPGLWMRLVELADVSGWRLLSLNRHSGAHLPSLRQTSYQGVPVTEITTPHLRYHQLVLKRAFDLVGASLLLALAAPLMLVLAVAIRMSSPGPVFFTQERVGLGGKRFRILKFRSMVVDAERRLEECASSSVYRDRRLFKVLEDPRVTRLGRFMRRTSLDELPQLINVIRGDMSLVGPRPPLPQEVVLYDAHHYCRFDVKPGITGPWQVGGRNNVTDFEEVVLLEREYIRNWNLTRDLRILIETVPVVLSRRGAA